MSWNVQLKCSSDAHLESLISLVELSFPQWDILFLQEADTFQSTTHELKHACHRVFRHWPGPGSRSLVFVVNAALSHVPCSVRSQNRVLGLDLCMRTCGKRRNICLVGVHGPHDTLDMHDHIGDVAHILGGRLERGDVAVLGDWNVDYAPTFAHCPSSDSCPNMTNRRDILQAFVDSNSLSLSFPASIDDLPVDCRWHDMCSRFAFTRVPDGLQRGEPSLIDFAAASPNFVSSCVGSWKQVPSDHCIVAISLNCRVRVLSRPRSTWVLSDREAAICYTLANWPRTFKEAHLSADSTPDRFFEFLRTVRDVNSCNLSCKSRRERRFPFRLRLIQAKFHRAHGPEKLALRSQLWHARVAWFKQLGVWRVRESIDRGKVVCKSKRLHAISNVASASGATFSSDFGIVNTLGDHFARKFGSNNANLRQIALDFMRVSQGSPPPVDEISVENALMTARKPLALDGYGICTELLRVAFLACPQQFCAWIMHIVGDESMISSLRSPMRCFGKESRCTPISKVRALMPLGALLKFLDRLLSSALRDALWSVFPKRQGCIIGAQRFTQTADIGHGVQLLMEKGGDCKSQAALAQGDISTYFDALPLVRICLFLRRKHVDVKLLCAVMRHQLLTRLVLERHGETYTINMRSSGGITGSTLALTLARIPVEGVFRDLLDDLRPFGFPFNHGRLVFGSWVDNIYCASDTAENACHMLSRVFDLLKRDWGLDLKSGSGSCLVARGHDFGDFEPASEIPLVSSVEVLGWWISDNASMSLNWQRTVAACWAAFYANVRSRGWKRLGVQRRLALLDRVVRPLLSYKLRIHGPSPHYFSQLQKLQRHMVSRACGNFRLATEDWKSFCSRVARHAKSLVGTKVSDWAQNWVKGALRWDAHLRRDNSEQLKTITHGADFYTCTSFSWAASLVCFLDSEYFDQRRRVESRDIFGRVHTRTNTRSCTGHVPLRWHDSIAFCKTVAKP